MPRSTAGLRTFCAASVADDLPSQQRASTLIRLPATLREVDLRLGDRSVGFCRCPISKLTDCRFVKGGITLALQKDLKRPDTRKISKL